jgi:hypothetical protein
LVKLMEGSEVGEVSVVGELNKICEVVEVI